MKNKNFASLGLVTIAMALNACTPYDDYDKNYQLSEGQNQVALTLGDAFQTSLYNVKEPVDVTYTAQKEQKIIIDGKEYPAYKVHINPQESINLKFSVYKEGKKELIDIETHVNTFKEVFKPANRRNIEERSGKTTQVVGEKSFYTLADNQKDVLVELHEHNKRKKHYFYYLNANHDVKIRMIAPKYTSFVFENGAATKEYSFIMKKDENLGFSMTLKPDHSQETYQRVYRFGRR